MGAGGQVTMEALPALKVLLHAAKHPHAAVCGILLGPKENAARVDDAVPLFHHPTMAPLMETAFLLVEQYASQTGKRLAGLYYAPAEATPTGGQPAPPQLLAAAEQMQGHYPGAVLVTVDNRALGGRQAVPFQAHAKEEGGGWGRSSALQVGPEGLAAFTRVLGGGGGGGGKGGSGLEACWSLVDMDEHLDDAGKDFRNPQVQKLLLSSS